MDEKKYLADLIYRFSPMGRLMSEHLADVLLREGYEKKGADDEQRAD